LIALAVMPVLTRLYDPAAYGLMGLYVSVVTIATAVAAGRYEAAVTLPPETEEGERDALDLVRLALTISTVFSTLALVAIGLLAALGGVPLLASLGPWAFAIPLGVLATSGSLTLNSYANRMRMYSLSARVAPIQKAAGATVQVAGGLAGWGPAGLMLGAVLSPLFGLRVLYSGYRSGVARADENRWAWDGGRLRAVARRYSDFPLVSTWFALLNALAWNLQAVVINWHYSLADVGQYSLAFAMVTVPTTLILGGVSQVYLKELSTRVADGKASARLTLGTVKGLLLLSVPVFLGLWAGGRYLFGPLFGPAWADAGAVAVAMLPLTWARFLTAPITSAFNVYRRPAVQLIWQISTLLSTLAVFIAGGQRGWPLTDVVWVASLVVAPQYLLLIPVVMWIIRSGVARDAP
jgi:O-antigen/teichoic acid export membrane protein